MVIVVNGNVWSRVHDVSPRNRAPALVEQHLGRCRSAQFEAEELKRIPPVAGNDGSHNLFAPFGCDATASGVQIMLIDRQYQIAFAESLPSQTISRIQQDLVGFSRPVGPLRSAEQNFNVRFVCHASRFRNNHRSVISVARIECVNVPSIHSSSWDLTLAIALRNDLRAPLTASRSRRSSSKPGE